MRTILSFLRTQQSNYNMNTMKDQEDQETQEWQEAAMDAGVDRVAHEARVAPGDVAPL